MTKARNLEVRNAFIEEFRKRDFNAGLNRESRRSRAVLAAAKAEAGGVLRAAAPARAWRPGTAGPPGRSRGTGGGGGGFGLSSLLGIGLLILAVLFGIRLLGSLFGGGNRGYAGPHRMGGPGPGYGARAMAAAWRRWRRRLHVEPVRRHRRCPGRQLALRPILRDGHHGGGTVDQSSMAMRRRGGSSADAAPTEWGGGDGGGDWGGDWGGGDGGGGDWGGGGGGDWGGGGGGGDWGGGGDGGGGGDW